MAGKRLSPEKALPALTQTKNTLSRMEGQFSKALPSNVPSKKFVRIVQTAISQPDIAKKISEGNLDQQSLWDSCMKAAQDGLVLDGREAALLTFYSSSKKTNMAQYIPMVAGLIKKARNSGEVINILATVVYENDDFDYWIDEEGEHLNYRPCKDRKNKGAPELVFAMCTLKDGGSNIAVMYEDDVMGVARHSKNTDQYSPKKGQWFAEWWKKTAIRRLSKTMPSSSDLERAFQHDNDNFNDFESEPETAQPGSAESANADIADMMQDQAPAEKDNPPIDAKSERVEDSGDNQKSGDMI